MCTGRPKHTEIGCLGPILGGLNSQPILISSGLNSGTLLYSRLRKFMIRKKSKGSNTNHLTSISSVKIYTRDSNHLNSLERVIYFFHIGNFSWTPRSNVYRGFRQIICHCEQEYLILYNTIGYSFIFRSIENGSYVILFNIKRLLQDITHN